MSYTIEEHKHRLAAWAASRAASVNGCRFTVKKGVLILEQSGFDKEFISPTSLPDPENVDAQHRKWRKEIIEAAENNGHSFTHGVAAKLINCYLKVRFVCGGHDSHERVSSLHPPIDKILLTTLATSEDPSLKELWKSYRYASWSNFDSEAYEAVILLIRETIGASPLWSIEQHWRGYQ